MLEEGTKCPVCQVTTDGFEDHQVSCGGNGDWIHHHDSLRDLYLAPNLTQQTCTSPAGSVADQQV